MLPITRDVLRTFERRIAEASPGPWEAHHVLDPRTGRSERAVVRAVGAGGADGAPEECEVIAGADVPLTPANQAYLAAAHPDAVLGLVREVRRLHALEGRMDTLLELMRHVEAFLDQKGLTRQAQRFVEMRSQVEHLGGEPGAYAPAGAPERPVPVRAHAHAH